MKGPLDYLARWPLRLWLAMVGAFLYLPLLALGAQAWLINPTPSRLQKAQARLPRIVPKQWRL